MDLFDKKHPMLGDSSVDIKKQLGNVPWITKEGFLDPAQFPIDSVLKRALSDDDRQFRSGLNMLGAMNVHGRTEAGVFLLGLLVNCEDNWEKRIKIVEAMKGIDTKPCADHLFSELKRVKSSNTTRLYPLVSRKKCTNPCSCETMVCTIPVASAAWCDRQA